MWIHAWESITSFQTGLLEALCYEIERCEGGNEKEGRKEGIRREEEREQGKERWRGEGREGEKQTT